MQIVERLRKRKHKVAAGECIFPISTSDGVAGEGRRVAKILKTFLTIRTGAICAAKPRHAHSRAQRNIWRTTLNNLSYDLMAGNDPHLLRRQLSFDDMKIGAAHATGAHAQQHVTRPHARIRDISDLKRTL